MQKKNYRKTNISLILVGILGFSLNASAHKSTFQTSNGIDITGVGTITAGTMVRTRKAVDARLDLSGLDANSAYTVWWIVFNKPENCKHPITVSGSLCGEADVPDSVFYAAGFVTGNNGSANVTTHLRAGKLPAGLQVLKPGKLKRGHGLKAEFHMVVSTHGPILTGMNSPNTLADQIGSIGGGCGVNTCADQAAIIFPPVPKEPEESEE